VWRWDQQEPFGSNPANDDPDGNAVAFDLPLRLPGQRYDAETALNYNYFRNYDPSLGRYAESDGLGLVAGPNTYAYANGSPVLYVDPKGEVADKVVAGCILIGTTVYFVYKYKKWIECIENCVVCSTGPRADPNRICPPPPDDGNTGAIYSCRTYCSLELTGGARGKGADGSRSAP
jgi:RHS repeat-associated protein